MLRFIGNVMQFFFLKFTFWNVVLLLVELQQFEKKTKILRKNGSTNVLNFDLQV